MAQAGPASLAVVAHLVCAVGTALVHTDALGAALHLRLLAAVGWGAEANEGGVSPATILPQLRLHPREVWILSPKLREDKMVYST